MNKQIFEYHPLIGYKFIPDLKTRIQHEAGGYLLRTNNWGFRSEHDFTVEKKADTKRILFFGDSFTAGDGVSNKSRYTDLLGLSLPNTEIFNFGLPGSGTDQQFILFQEYGINVKCDLIVVSVLVENIRRIKSHYRYYYDDAGNKVIYQKPFYSIEDNKLVLHNTPVNQQPLTMDQLPPEEHSKVDTGGRFGMARSVINALGLKDLTQKITKYQPVAEYNEKSSDEWLLMEKILVEWSKLTQAKFLVIPLPLYQFVEETSDAAPYQKRFNELSSEYGIDVFDPLAELQKYSTEQRRNFRHKNDVHPTAEGHAAIAKSIQPAIYKLLS